MTCISSPPAMHFGAGLPPGVQARVRSGARKAGAEFVTGIREGWASPAKTLGTQAGEAVVGFLILAPLTRTIVNDTTKGLAKRLTSSVREGTRKLGERFMDFTRPARNSARNAVTAQSTRDVAIITGGAVGATYLAAQKSPAVRTALNDAVRTVASAFKRSNPVTP